MKIAVGSDSVQHIAEVVTRHLQDKGIAATAPSTEPHRVIFHRKVDELDARGRPAPQK